MKTLKEHLWVVVKEYTQQIADLFDGVECHWIGTDYNGNHPATVLDLDGEYFLTFDEVQIIVDYLDKWVSIYGSREAVVQEVKDWEDLWLNLPEDEPYGLFEIWEERHDRYVNLHPRIGLEHWLMGCPREKRERSNMELLRELRVKRELVTDLAKTYRESRSLWNIIDNLTSDIKLLEEKVLKEEKAVNPDIFFKG